MKHAQQAAFNWNEAQPDPKPAISLNRKWDGDTYALIDHLKTLLTDKEMEELALGLMNEYIYDEVWSHFEAIEQEIEYLTTCEPVTQEEAEALKAAGKKCDEAQHTLFLVWDRLDTEREKSEEG